MCKSDKNNSKEVKVFTDCLHMKPDMIHIGEVSSEVEIEDIISQLGDAVVHEDRVSDELVSMHLGIAGNGSYRSCEIIMNLPYSCDKPHDRGLDEIMTEYFRKQPPVRELFESINKYRKSKYK